MPIKKSNNPFAGKTKSAVGKILRRELPKTVQPDAKAC